MQLCMLWREKELLEILKEGKLKTSEIVKRARMSKATALKYLERLKGKGLVNCEEIGPTKLWFLREEIEERDGRGDEEKKEEEARKEVVERKKIEWKKVEECIYVDKRVFKLIEEFERVTGKSFKILINKNGVRLILGAGDE
ncbi:MAG: winged helix-turn-helix domain-containing protein [Candidatus Methanospirare jalkutatii]|nr:winged helix-turn-helix domain-containing protein [Candidatus Methanospirare jalkutatii]